jgi:hypothetical protein
MTGWTMLFSSPLKYRKQQPKNYVNSPVKLERRSDSRRARELSAHPVRNRNPEPTSSETFSRLDSG